MSTSLCTFVFAAEACFGCLPAGAGRGLECFRVERRTWRNEEVVFANIRLYGSDLQAGFFGLTTPELSLATNYRGQSLTA